MAKYEIEKFKEDDVYSLAMFFLYKVTGLPEYSTLSELSYILDKNNLLRFCEYFGGTTIKVPTLDELHTIMSLILIHQSITVGGMSFIDAVNSTGYRFSNAKKMKVLYNRFCKVMESYNIETRDRY